MEEQPCGGGCCDGKEGHEGRTEPCSVFIEYCSFVWLSLGLSNFYPVEKKKRLRDNVLYARQHQYTGNINNGRLVHEVHVRFHLLLRRFRVVSQKSDDFLYSVDLGVDTSTIFSSSEEQDWVWKMPGRTLTFIWLQHIKRPYIPFRSLNPTFCEFGWWWRTETYLTSTARKRNWETE